MKLMSKFGTPVGMVYLVRTVKAGFQDTTTLRTLFRTHFRQPAFQMSYNHQVFQE